MPPSKESDRLKDLWRFIVRHSPDDANNVALERIVYDQISTASSEPTDVTYEDITIDVNHRGPAKLIRPLHASKAHVLLFCHGGGYSFGSLDSHRKMCGHFAKACNTLALMIDYRLTPEHPYPAALDDCVAGYKWLLDQGFEAKHLVTIGDSCGGGLATTVPLKAIGDGLPAPAAAVALSPWYDVVCKESASLSTTTDVLGTMEGMYKIRNRYCGANGSVVDPADPLVSAIYASNEELGKLPPHWISCAGDDMLLDDGKRTAAKLQQAGVETVLKVHEGMQHVFEFLAGRAPEADASIKDVGAWVRGKIGS
ncbi:hypothetical protein LTR53_012876 [Teratosphaeriaceae sp. CCFEE 6253]|nr:hypothetical protein LTR53_012876 [Teratosphaeriaceae sp. CCFEE 6253]